MIDRSTVFVLGAGASQPYGFPLGVELTKLIANWINSGGTAFEKEMGTVFPAEAIGEARQMARALRTVEGSVDLWLAQRKKYLTVGRYCVARFIAQQEDPDALFRGEWYANLFRLLLPADLPVGAEALLKNPVTFVTFNYDRSLEQTLFLKTQSFFGLSDEVTTAVISKLRIIHVHGQVGRLPWQKAEGWLKDIPARPYAPNFKPEELFHAACVKVISETTRDSPEYQAAQEALRQASRICFLGFGYDPQNLARLNYGAGVDSKTIQGTHYQLPQLRSNQLKGNGAEFGIRIDLDGPSSGTTDYFREMIGA